MVILVSIYGVEIVFYIWGIGIVFYVVMYFIVNLELILGWFMLLDFYIEYDCIENGI